MDVFLQKGGFIIMIKTITYDAVDREILNALKKGVNTYEMNSKQRSIDIKRSRAKSATQKSTELKKLASFGRV